MTTASPSADGEARDPRLLPFLPLIYIAWADGELGPDEIRTIRRGLAATPGLDEDASKALNAWLDPLSPPSPQDLQQLLHRIREAGRDLAVDRRLNLTDLALELARAEGGVSTPERAALERIEQDLHLSGPEVTSALLHPERPAPPAHAFASSFDVARLAALLDGNEHEVRQRVRDLVSGPEFALPTELSRQAYREQVLRWCRRLVEHGLGALGIPQPYEGAGDMRGFLATFETLAHHDLSLLVKFGVQFGLFGGSVQQLGTERHHRRFLAPIGQMELTGGFAMTETAHGSNVHDIETVARYDPETETFILHTPHSGARKDYIGNAARDGRLMVVFAQLEIGEASHGVHAFVVPIRSRDGETLPGVTIEDCGPKMGLDGVDNGRLDFDRVRVPRENLLNRFADVSAEGEYSSPIPSPGRRFFTMLGTLVGGRVSVALAGLSTAKTALDIAVRYAERRHQFGPAGQAETTLLDYLTHQRRLLLPLATTYGLHFALRELADRYVDALDDADKRRRVETLAAGLKAYATWHATATIQTCRECCGGAGYMAVNRFAALKADSDVFTTFEGDNTVLLQLAARSLLSGLKREFGNMSLTDLARHAARLAATALAELNPVVIRNTDQDHLRGRDFQLDALRYRADRLLRSLASRLRDRLDDGMSPQRALIECQDHALEAALAHVESFILQQFDHAIEAVEEPSLGPVLERLRSIFALRAIERERGWYLEKDVLAATKSEAIRTQVNLLCTEIRPDAEALCRAFSIPEASLAAPIALSP
jgi:acyl-CoA oxidase